MSPGARRAAWRRRDVLLVGASAAAVSLAGCSGDGGNSDPSSRGPVRIDEVAFAADRPDGYDEYDPQSDSTYDPDDVVWVYAALSNVSGDPVVASGDATQLEANGSPTVDVDLRHQLRVEAPDDSLLAETTDEIQQTLSVRQLDSFFVATDVLHAGTPASGEYETTVTVTDRVSETDVTETATFSIDR